MRALIDLPRLVTHYHRRLRMVLRRQRLLLLNDLLFSRVQLILWEALTLQMLRKVRAKHRFRFLHLGIGRRSLLVRVGTLVARRNVVGRFFVSGA